MSDTSTRTPIYGPRPYHLSETDQRGCVLTISILCIIYTCTVLMIRLISRQRNVGPDDWLSVVATAFAISQFGAVAAATVNGSFGSSYNLLSSSDIETAARCIRVGDVLFLLAIFFDKCSVLLLTRRLFTGSQHQKRRLCELTIGLCAVWWLGSTLVITIECDAKGAIHPYAGVGCPGLENRWVIIGVFNAVLEIIMWILSLVVVAPLQMSRTKKLKASASFEMRLPIIVLIVLNVKFVSDLDSASDAGIAVIKPVLVRQAELFYALFSAAAPALNQYLRKFDTRNVTQFGYHPEQYELGVGNYEMSNPTSHRTERGGGNTNRNHGTGNTDGFAVQSSGAGFRPPGYPVYHARIEGPKVSKSNEGICGASQDDGSVERHGSEEHIIRKEVVYHVRSE